MNKTTSAYLTVILILVSCTGDQQSLTDHAPPLYPAPQTLPLNTSAGYSVNAVTGDSIFPLISSSGDTILTGIAVPAFGQKIHPDSVVKALVVPAGSPAVEAANSDVYQIPEILTVVPIPKNSLSTFTPGSFTSSFILKNSTGDILPTGVPIPITGKVVPCLHRPPVMVLPPRIKDNTSGKIKYLDVEQGMNSSYIMSILEDSRGKLWFGTAGGGISEFNGSTLTSYAENEGFSDHIVQSILEDSQGRLWFSTYMGGVCMYDGEAFTHFTENEGLSNNNVRPILEDSQGKLWFGTFGGGVSRYDGTSITHFTEKEGLSNNIVNAILEDREGNLWFGTGGGGACMYDGETFTHYREDEGLSNNIVYSIQEDHRGHLWFGTWGGGLSKYDGESFTVFTEAEGLSNNYVWSILEDKHHILWIATHGGGVSKYDGESFTHFTEDAGLSFNDVYSILEDSQGNMWFGTNGGGVSIYKNESFAHYTKRDGLRHDLVYSILEDSQGNMWFGTWGGGVIMFDGERFSHFTEEEGLCHTDVNAIMEDSQGNMWFGTRGGGACMYDGRSFTLYTEKEGLIHNDIWSITEDSHGNIWFGSFGGGACKFDGERFTYFTDREGLSNNVVFCILEDSRGRLWFGTMGGGASMYNGDTFTHYTEKEGLSSNIVVSITEDSQGHLWFATGYGGVSLFNGESFTYFSEREGLSNNLSYSIVEDSSSHIWISTEVGLNRLEPGNDLSFFTDSRIHSYGLQDGLKALDFYPSSGLMDRKNRIWWGSGKGLNMLDMNEFSPHVNPPVLTLNRIEINEQFVDFRHLKEGTGLNLKFNGVSRFDNCPLELELPYNHNHLTFHFSALDWAAPHKIRYSYKMEGLNDHWSIPGTEAKADYRNLPHGTYTFKASAIGLSQTWSDSFEYTFTINPPWWSTWWARAAYAFFALLSLIGFVRLRTARLKQRQKELEAEVVQATQTIREQKEEVESTLENLKLIQSQLIQSEKMASVGILTAGIAHELNNPINFVSSNVNPLKRDMEDVFSLIKKYDDVISDRKLETTFAEVGDLKNQMEFSFLVKEIDKLLEGIEDGAGRSSQIVKGLRSFSRMDEEQRQLYQIHEGIDSTLILLHNKIKNRITVRKDYGEIREIECFPGKLNQVFMNILTNSLQAIEEEGEIIIRTVPVDPGVKIYIKDNGSGMTAEVKKHIFDPFYTTKDVGKGTGLGLSISYGIIEQHHGTIEVLSEPGKGSEFIITLPETQE